MLLTRRTTKNTNSVISFYVGSSIIFNRLHLLRHSSRKKKMKKKLTVLILLVAATFTSCTPEETVPDIYTPTNFVDQEWLIGEWRSQDESDILLIYHFVIYETLNYGKIGWNYDQSNSEKLVSNSTQFTVSHVSQGLKDFRKTSDTSLSLNGKVFLKQQY